MMGTTTGRTHIDMSPNMNVVPFRASGSAVALVSASSDGGPGIIAGRHPAHEIVTIGNVPNDTRMFRR
jgi:hypothetical protein